MNFTLSFIQKRSFILLFPSQLCSINLILQRNEKSKKKKKNWKLSLLLWDCLYRFFSPAYWIVLMQVWMQKVCKNEGERKEKFNFQFSDCQFFVEIYKKNSIKILSNLLFLCIVYLYMLNHSKMREKLKLNFI